MTARALRFDVAGLESDEIRARTRWTMAASVVVHALLLLWLVLGKPAAGELTVLTEITLLTPGDLESAPAAGRASAARAPQPEAGARIAQSDEDHFRRAAPRSETAPDPQSATAVADRMNARLAVLRDVPVTPIAGSAAAGAPSAIWSSPAGVPGALGSGGRSLTLDRGRGDGGGPPRSLGRGATPGMSTALAAAATPSANAGRASEAPAGDPNARRSLAGADLAGPIADRAIVHSVTPAYPDWAKRDGVEGAVTLSFVVRADGTVKENVLIQKTAGFADFDDNARSALSAWRFEPLRGGRTGEQWGTITFRYRLRDA